MRAPKARACAASYLRKLGKPHKSRNFVCHVTVRTSVRTRKFEAWELVFRSPACTKLVQCKLSCNVESVHETFTLSSKFSSVLTKSRASNTDFSHVENNLDTSFRLKRGDCIKRWEMAEWN